MLIDAPSSYRDINGKWHHHVRQSDIKTFRQCPELHRKKLTHEVTDYENDVAIIGTACHAGIEYALTHDEADIYECMQVAMNTLVECWNKPNLWQVSIASLGDACGLVKLCFTVWWNEVRPIILAQDIVAVEYRFDVKVYEDIWRCIYLSGTSDLWLADSIVDWKHSTHDYNKDAWKLDRYDPQCIIYPWARDQLELNANPDWADGIKYTIEFDPSAALCDFTFVNINRDNQRVQWQTVEPTRTVGHCLALLDDILGLCKLIEAKVSSWPLGASDWWCSPVWCPAWNQCKGKHLGPDPWGLLERKRKQAGIGLPSIQVEIETGE